MPFASFLVPSRLNAFLLESHIFLNIMLLGNLGPVFEYLRGSGVEVAPLRPRFEAQLIRMSGNVWLSRLESGREKV